MASSAVIIVTTCGREVGDAEVEHAAMVVRQCSGLSRKELALTLCEHWQWVAPTGSFQVQSCVKLLETLERKGRLRLPEKKNVKVQRQPRPGTPTRSTAQTDPQQPVTGELSVLQSIELELASDRATTNLWREFVERYHPLGCKLSIGCTLRYFVSSPQGRLGCILMGSAAVAIAARDRWIGWSRQQRLQHLPWVINNQRLLLFPWVRVSNLVSHALGQVARRVQADWEVRWGYRPVLMETFVDPAHHRGVGYLAAGWQMLGETTGQGICRPNYKYRTTPKLIFVRPLSHDFRDRLCSALRDERRIHAAQ